MVNELKFWKKIINFHAKLDSNQFHIIFSEFHKFWNSGIPDSIFSLKDKAFIFPQNKYVFQSRNQVHLSSCLGNFIPE